MWKYCESVNCPWYKGRCTSPNDHTKKPNGEIECDYDRGIIPGEKIVYGKAIKPICKIIFDVPYYFCGDCKAMLNMYSTKAKFCSQCGQIVQWSACVD